MEPVKKITSDDCEEWRLVSNGKLHREDGPAFINRSGINDLEEWFINGERHREDGPAYINNNHMEWHLHGKLHREDGPAIIFHDGTETWYRNEKIHREDGPAIVHPNGIKEWYQYGQLHRIDGPAFVDPNAGIEEWWFNAEEITDLVFSFMKEHNVRSVEEMDEEVQCLFWIMLGSI